MKFNTFSIKYINYDSSTDELLTYLSQVVMSRVDEEVSKKHQFLSVAKKNSIESKSELSNIKLQLVDKLSEKRRLGTLKRCLQVIETLRREGRLTGNNRTKVSKLLWSIQDMGLSVLRELEEKLIVYLPDPIHSRIT